MPKEINDENLEEALKTGEFEGLEEEPSTAEFAEEEASEEVAEELPSLDELQERLAKLEEELRHKTGALAEERDRRRTVEGQHAMLMDAIKEARERAAAQMQPAIPQEEYDEEYRDYLQAVEKRFGPLISQIIDRQSQLEQYLQQQFMTQHQAQTFAHQSQAFKAKAPDYEEALKYLIDKARQRASVFYQDQAQIDQAVALHTNQLIQFSPEQLYNLAKIEGYQQKASDAGRQKSAPKQTKSLASIAGAAGGLDNLKTKAHKLAEASLKELESIPAEELDAILKSIT